LIRAYFSLTKPGIIFGNAITAIAGFFLASKGQINVGLFLATLVGISFVIASACVFNNYFDRNIDKVMKRTKHRALAEGVITVRNALIFGAILGAIGFFLLIFYTNLLTTVIAAIGFFFYVALYTPWKKRSVHGTIIGSVSGAVPPLVGYCAVSNRLDAGALILFFILVLWQMPHFYAIAIYRLEDYKAAKIPVLPTQKSLFATKFIMLLYVIAFALVACMLTFFGYTGKLYLLLVAILGIIWIGWGLKGFWTKDNKRWARKMFILSLITLTALCIMMIADVTVY
jgi:heme o synthase